jgi:hypothetical protein
MNEILDKINVAPSSTSGHYVEEAEEVINLDEINETYYIKGRTKLSSKNHTTLIMEEDCMITCQRVYNPYTDGFVRAVD